MNNKEPMRDYKNSDNILTNAMFEKNITQKEIASKIGISQQTVSKYINFIENDRLPTFKQIDTLSKIFTYVGVDLINYLIKFKI